MQLLVVPHPYSCHSSQGLRLSPNLLQHASSLQLLHTTSANCCTPPLYAASTHRHTLPLQATYGSCCMPPLHATSPCCCMPPLPAPSAHHCMLHLHATSAGSPLHATSAHHLCMPPLQAPMVTISILL